MNHFLEGKLRHVFTEFQAEINELGSLCPLKSLRFDSNNFPDYSNKVIQQLYLLRYLPAYSIEYYRIYDKIVNEGFVSNYNVLSIGAGSGIDFYGLYFALNRNLSSISYTGLDRVEWYYKDNFNHSSYDFIYNDINNWAELDWEGYNIIIFPKSIGEFDKDTFDNLLCVFANSDFINDRIYLISSIRDQHIDVDMGRFEQVINVFETEQHYRCLDRRKEYYHFPVLKGLILYYPYLSYPQDIIDYISSLSSKCKVYIQNQRSCDSDCDNLYKYPILSNKYMKYQFVRLER